MHFDGITHDPPICECGEETLIKTSSTNKNPGRRFYDCKNYRKTRSCNYFHWLNSPLEPRYMVAFNRLLKEFEAEKQQPRRMFALCIFLFYLVILTVHYGVLSRSIIIQH